MHVASAWVAVIIVLSLAIIRLLNQQGGLSSSWRNQDARPFAPLPAEGPNPVSPPAASTGGERMPSATLQIDFDKSLANFTLQARLNTGRGAVGLLGPSGSGKSMTLRLIAGLVCPDRGSIVLNGRTLYDSKIEKNIPSAQRRIGMVFQDYALFPHMTVAENVAFGVQSLPLKESSGRVQRQLELMRIGELAARYPGQLSGGQKQRVAIARCMAIEPDALLLDEPFAALDSHLRRQMEEQLRETLAIYNGVVVFVTHDMEEAFRFCSDLLVLDEGHVIASGPKQQLFENPNTVAAAQLTGCKNIVPAHRLTANTIRIERWACDLVSTALISANVTHAGYRSHHFLFQEKALGDNVFPCWLVDTSEAPHEMTLYLRLHHESGKSDGYHLQADVTKELWRALSSHSQPWKIKIDPDRILLLEK